MNDVERLFHEDLKLNMFQEVVGDEDYEFVDVLDREDDECGPTSEEI
jgi:hypothetical protein